MRNLKIYLCGLFVLLCVGAAQSGAYLGRFLVVDRPAKSDVILVLNGDANDRRFWTAMELSRAGYGDRVLLDERGGITQFGATEAEAAERFAKSRPEFTDVVICSGKMESTVGETEDADNCLKALHAHTVLLVTSDFHTRRAFSIFRQRLPQYGWSVAAASDPAFFGTQWWRERAWRRTILLESQKLLWWEAVDRWRYGPIAAGTPPAAGKSAQITPR